MWKGATAATQSSGSMYHGHMNRPLSDVHQWLVCLVASVFSHIFMGNKWKAHEFSKEGVGTHIF